MRNTITEEKYPAEFYHFFKAAICEATEDGVRSRWQAEVYVDSVLMKSISSPFLYF